MSKCVYCRERKGRRPCPALNGSICSQCCGQSRVVSIACRPDCVYLDANVDYQQKRVGDHFEHGRRTLYRELMETWGDKATKAFYFLEVVTFKHFHARRDGQDGEIIAAIQALRRSFSPIHVPEGMAPAFTEALKKEYQVFMEGEKIEAQLVSDVLDRGLTFIVEFSGTGLRSNRFLNGLIGFLKHQYPAVAEELTKMGNAGGPIILPGNVKPENQPSPILGHQRETF